MADVRQRRPQRPPSSPRDQPWDDGLLPLDGKPRRRSSGKHHTSVPHIVPLILGFVLFYAAVIGTIGHFHMWLPDPVGVDAPRNVFSEARARIVLEKIMSFGYRPVGSKANDVLTPEYLLSQIESIKVAAPRDVRIEVDVQRPTGAFGLDFLTQFQNIYANVTNIVVRVSSTAPDAVNVLDNSLMLSSHYDAAIGGAAASDDGVNIAIMMELLRYYSVRPPKHASLVFNFNGAEETIMQAAHGFITQHPWTKNIRAFINLEAAGAGGRELLFQTGSDELVLAYAEGAKYPHASIIAQELFQTGVIPADTDFRVYRDFGAVAGMDFAYIANGYVYHTKLDDVSRIQPGAIQRLGDNLVGVIDRLTNIPGRLGKVAATPHSSNTLFFDIAGLTMVSMGKSAATVTCSAILLFAVIYVMRSPLSLGERVGALKLLSKCVGSGLGASLFVALIMTLFAPLSWYSAPYLGAVTFIAPALGGMIHQLVKFLEKQTEKGPVALWRVEESLFEAMMCTWLFGLAMMLTLGAISSYVMAVWVIFPLVGQMLCHSLQRLQWLTSSSYIVISLAAVAIPALHSGFVLAVGFMFFIPLLGRCGPEPPPDVIIAVVFFLSLVVMLSYTSRFFCFIPVKRLVALRNLMAIVTINAVVIASLRNPYTEITPKRMMVQHVQREVRHPNGTIAHQDAGLWVNAVDFRGLAPVRPFLAGTRWQDTSLIAPPPALLDKLHLYGDLPFGLPIRDYLPERHSWYLPAKQPAFTPDEDAKPTLTVVSSQYDAIRNRRKVHLHLSGPAHLHIFIDATKTKLTSWSVGNGMDGPVPASSESTYILQFATGLPPSSFHFWLEAESEAPIDIAIAGHYLEKTTPEMQELLDVFPPWMTALHFVSTWQSQTI